MELATQTTTAVSLNARAIGGRCRRLAPLLLVCGASLLLALPTIHDHIRDPNLITYFSADEGGQMDLAWWHYSGVRRDSVQWEAEYGLETVYVADLARLVLAPCMTVTPGTLVLLARWLHLLAWLGAYVALWRLVGRHVGTGWPQTVAITLMAVRPAFAYLNNNWKPDAVILWLSLLALDYALRNVERPSRRAIYIATMCAAAAFVVKYTALFVLPAIVASMYVAARHHPDGPPRPRETFPRLQASWLLYALLGAGLLALAGAMLTLYVRHSTGRTWYQEFGLWGSLQEHPAFLLVGISGLLLVGLSAGLRWLQCSRRPFVQAALDRVQTFNSCALITCALFLGCTLVFGYRWLLMPRYFLTTYSQLASSAVGTPALERLSTHGVGSAMLVNVLERMRAFDPLLLLLLAGYMAVELWQWRSRERDEVIARLQRLTLAVFLLPFALVVLSMVRVAGHHMLPFVAVACVLGVAGVRHWLQSIGRPRLKVCALAILGVLLFVDLGWNGTTLVRQRLRTFHHRDDIAFAVAAWCRGYMPPDASIVADHPTRVYILPEWRNVRSFRGYQDDRVAQLRRLVDAHHPAFIYYNAGSGGATAMPPIGEMLPAYRTELVKAFDASESAYPRMPDDRFVIYRVIY